MKRNKPVTIRIDDSEDEFTLVVARGLNMTRSELLRFPILIGKRLGVSATIEIIRNLRQK